MKFFFALIILLYSCKSKEIAKDPMLLSVGVSILDTNLSLDANTQIGYTKSLENEDKKFVKLKLLNEGNDMKPLLYEKYYFYSNAYYFRKLYHKSIGRFQTYSRSKVYLKKDSSLTIYTDKYREADTFFFPLFWKRDSLGIDELKFYKDEKGELKYHSAKMLQRGFKLKKSYKRFENCPTIPVIKIR